MFEALMLALAAPALEVTGHLTAPHTIEVSIEARQGGAFELSALYPPFFMCPAYLIGYQTADALLLWEKSNPLPWVLPPSKGADWEGECLNIPVSISFDLPKGEVQPLKFTTLASVPAGVEHLLLILNIHSGQERTHIYAVPLEKTQKETPP